MFLGLCLDRYLFLRIYKFTKGQLFLAYGFFKGVHVHLADYNLTLTIFMVYVVNIEFSW